MTGVQEMRVYIISAAYPPEAVTAARIACDIAEAMTQRGHAVTVFAPFPNRPTGKVMPGYQRSLRQVEYRDGYRIIYSWHTLSKRSTLASRMTENVSFGITSTLQVMREPTPDVVYMNTWPIFAQWMNMAVLSHRRVPVICAVKDLYPETLSNLGRISQNNPIVWLTKAIGTQVYRQSTLIAPLNPLMGDYIIADRGIHPGKIRVLSDWIDASHFPRHQPKDGNFRKKHAFSSELFLAMYVGSMTYMAGLELYVATAERLRHRQDIRLILIGDGAMRETIEGAIRQKALENIQLIYPLKPEEVAEVQAAADVLLLSLLPGAAEHATPSKLIFYMFSQRPVLASVHAGSPPARIIQDAKCGYVIRQGDPQELAAKLEQMADDRISLQQLGENARRYAEENFLKDNLLPRVCNLLEQIAHPDSQANDGTGCCLT